MVAFCLFFVVLNPFAAPSWLPQTDLTVELASSVILSSPLSCNHRAFFDSNNICSLRTPLCPRFFNVALCYTVWNDLPKIFTMFWRFKYFASVLSPEYLVMLLPWNIAMNECRTKPVCLPLASLVILREDTISTCWNRGLNDFWLAN